MTKKRLPADVLAYFRQQGAKDGKKGGPRSLETMTSAQRSARAKKFSLAAAEKRLATAAAKRPAKAEATPATRTGGRP
jgi:hypothetical protein